MVLWSHEKRDSTKPSETKRRHRVFEFHKKRVSLHADLDHSGKTHGPFCLHNLEDGLYRAMGIRYRRHSSSSEHAAPPRGVRISTTSEVCLFPPQYTVHATSPPY